MKKALLLAGAALLALVACNKSETVTSRTPGEISFKAVTGNITKAGELNGSFMPAATYKIYAAATQKNASGIIENPSFFSAKEVAFGAADETAKYSNLWRAATPVYWPIGGVKMDFLAYALPSAKHAGSCFGEGDTPSGNTWKAKWDQSKHDIASILTFNEVNTYANQVDMLYAAANNQTSAANGNADPNNYDPADPSTDQRSVKLDFKHAQALLIFNVQVNDVAPGVNIKEIAFLSDNYVALRLADQIADAASGSSTPYTAPVVANDDITLLTQGTFTVDNSKIDLEAHWSGLVPLDTQYAMPDGVAAVSDCNPGAGAKPAAFVDYNEAIESPKTANTWYQLGETLLIPEQDKQKFTITYTVSGKTYYYTYNDLKGTWQAGKKYIYNLDITINEIVITESVENFTSPTGYPMDVTLD